jgi:hypothetical protein
MKPTRILSAAGALLSTAFLLAFASSAKATPFPDLTYTVTLNLSSLNLDPNGPFSLDLQLLTGSGNQTNTVTLSDFTFTGGTATGTNFLTGNVSGSIASSLVLTSNSNPNTASDNEFAENFSSGVTQISFQVDQTPNSETVTSGTPIPEQFNVAILDDDLNNVPTTDPSGGNTLVSSPLGETSTLSTVDFYTLAVPEPNSAALSLLAAGGMLGLILMRRRRVA